MKHLTIQPASLQDCGQIAALAKKIWRQHYTPIIGAEQVEYMTDKFQSPAAVQQQMEQEAYRYFLFLWDGTPAGYMGIQPSNGALYLSKLYILQSFRGHHIAKEALKFALDFCRQNKLTSIWLTVNKQNTASIAAYEALGFMRTRSQTADIGNGYVMDDYIYEFRM